VKHFRIKKSETRRRPFIQDIRLPIPKPKFPRRMFWKIHEVKNIYLGWDRKID
jgi:hypothetical protein